MAWHDETLDRLLRSRTANGAWGYGAQRAPGAEPTAFACLALLEFRDHRSLIEEGLGWLASRQQESGGVAVAEGLSGPCWPTGLAVLAWNEAQRLQRSGYAQNCEKGVRWILKHEGVPFKSNPRIYGHNTQLKAWSWVDGTHSWLEPSSYALLALRATGHAAHPRSHEAMAVVRDRSISSGGWNYGNSKVFGAELRPFPAQTGMVLAAMCGQPRTQQVDAAIAFLHAELPRIRAPFSLAWGLIGMAAWNARPKEADAWLEQCWRRCSSRPAEPMCDALLLLAQFGRSDPFPLDKEHPLES